MQKTGFIPGVGKIPWRREWLPISVFWSRESPGMVEAGRLHGVAKELGMN